MGTIETGEIISAIRKRKNMSQDDIATLLNVSDEDVSKWEQGECYPKVELLPQLASILGISIDKLLIGRNTSCADCIATESKFNKQCTIEDYNYDYLQGTIICFIVITVALYLSLIGWYMIQVMSMTLIVISFCVFYLYDKKYSDLLNNHQLEIPMNFSGIQASCRQFIFSAGVTVSLFVNFVNINAFLIGDKYFISESPLPYTLMGAIFYTFTNLFLFSKSSKNNYKVSLYFHIGAILTILSSLIIIFYQIYIKIDMPNTIDNNKILQNKTNRLFILLMVICIIYSLLSFTLHNISNKYKGILFVLSIVQHSIFLLVGRHSIWFSDNATTNVHGGIYMGYIVIALTISMTLYYLQTCISRRIAQ